MAFSKKRVEDRKKWLTDYEPGTFLDMTTDDIKYDDFINKELILFSRADLLRSIPSAWTASSPRSARCSLVLQAQAQVGHQGGPAQRLRLRALRVPPR